jgi:hypothetical protein
MRIFFRVLLFIPIVFPLFSLSEAMRVFGHNQWNTRPVTRADTTEKPKTLAHFGLTGAQLAEVDEFIAAAYNKSVDDGYKLGCGYSRLWLLSLGLDALLLVASLIGLRLCRSLDRLTMRSSELPPADAAGSRSP